ncbi:MAG TPA: hypothetical protein VLF91_01735 [Candidatus Saccharimonadales bacterium]|nr:hypothetical protein [Candidatus Saccharimonadales bacterium]
MNKKLALFAAALLVIILVGIVILATRHASSGGAIRAACRTENPQLTVPSADRSEIELSAMSKLLTVPAGTHVDVRIATYGSGKATGSIIYPKPYGTYNFSVSKAPATAKDRASWQLGSFDACRN